MALTHTPAADLGAQAPAFQLPGVDGKTYSLESFAGAKALVVAFICNHCPYVKAVDARINALAKEYAPKGAALVAISANDAADYPEDSFDMMKKVAREHGYVFPYLYDESQEVAKAYGAVCTPDFFLYEKTAQGFVLRYRGRLDDSWQDERKVTRRDLAVALEAVLKGHEPAKEQPSSMGCSIKWK